MKALDYKKIYTTPSVDFYIGLESSNMEEESLKALLIEFNDVFARSHQELT